MPSPNTANKPPFQQAQDKLEFGQKLSKRKSQEFSAKVARWNSDGGGIASDDDIVVVVDDSNNMDDPVVVIVQPGDHHNDKENHAIETSSDGKTAILELNPSTPERLATSRVASRQVDLNRKAWVRRKSKTQADKVPEKAEVVVDIKHAGTPKKRVVSDGHWRRDRAAKPETPEPEKEKTTPEPKPLVIRNSVASIGLKLPPSVETVYKESQTRKPRRRYTRRSRSHSRSSESTTSREQTPDYESSGTRIYVKRRTPSRQAETKSGYRDLKAADNVSGDEKPRSPAALAPKAKPVTLTPPSAAVERYLRQLAPTQEQLNPQKPATAPSEVAPPKQKITRRSPQASAEHHAPEVTPPSVYTNRIQGWLATTDPFDDLGREIPKSTKQSIDSQTVSSDNTSREPPRTPTTLKRRGARRTATSPVKGGSSRDSANVDTDTSDIQQIQPLSIPKLMPSTGRELSTIASVETFHSHQEKRHRLFAEGSVWSRASDGDERNPPEGLQRRLTKHSDLISVLSVQRSSSKNARPRHSVRDRRTSSNKTLGDIMNDITTDELKYQRELRTLVDGVIPVLLQYVLSDNHSSGLLGKTTRDNQLVTKPIVDLGVALERLKSVHKRIPMHDVRDLISWAESSRSIYTGYIAAWRLGFQDVVVNLAPAQAAEKQSSSTWDNGLPRNNANELLGRDGERVDVAYLLKRPLVRLKQLAKTFELIDQLEPSHLARDMAKMYNDMVLVARKRLGEEQARLEDEAAAAIDPTRAREARTLAPIADVQIDATRCVLARDFFDIDFRHSSGQQVNCRVELIMRHDAPDSGSAGDVLFCEISTTGRWLLFPPIHSTMLSARRGRNANQMVIMLRGYRNDGREWREVMALDALDEDTINEWLNMLPSSPIPRNLAAKSSFDLKQNPLMSGALPEPSESGIERMPSIREMEVPLGERYAEPTERWDASEVNSDAGSYRPSTQQRKRVLRHRSQPAESIAEEPYAYETQEYQQDRLRRARGSRKSEQYSESTRKDYSVWLPSSRQPSEESSAAEDAEPISKRPSIKRRTSSVPSLEFPTVNKLRKSTQPDSTPQKDMPSMEPSTAPAKLQKRKTTPPETSHSTPTTPQSKRPTSFGLKSLPSFTPAFLKKHRRSSSPLKREYEPSIASSTSDSEISAVEHDESYTSDSTAEPLPDDQISTLGELKSFPTYGGYKQMKQATPPESVYAPSDPSLGPSQSASQAPYRMVPPPEMRAAESVASIFVWADSGSWESLHPEDCCIIVTSGLIEAFDSAQAHAAPAESAEEALQTPSRRGVKPLVALELTPLVPLRRGTALDISIRSPPTANSLYRTGSNIMFRSRNTEECEALYHMLNRARIDNPTYIALQRARGPLIQSNWAEVMEQQNESRSTSKSWFGMNSRKGSTYRSNSITRPQSAAATDSSVGTMQTAFSALRRFSGSNRIFNISKSTITSRQGSRSTQSDSLDSGVASPAQFDPALGTPLGLTNMKIRLYFRETASKWRDMGAGRLTILIPPRPELNAPANPAHTGREKRIFITGKTQGEVLMDATLGEASFERIARTGIAMSVWEENVGGLVATTGGVLAAKTKVYMIQMKSDREAAYTFGLVGKLRY